MRYAYFDPTSSAVIGWIDTERFHYDTLPDAATLAEVPADFDGPGDGLWEVVDGQLQERAEAPA